MPTTTDFSTATLWSIGLTVAFAFLAGLAFLLQWGIRFRLVGITGFMGVLTGGLFALSLVPFTRTAVPGAINYDVVFDNGTSQTVIKVPPTITETQLQATLQQAASDLFSYGRMGSPTNQLVVRARTVMHPEPGVSQLLLLGKATRINDQREDNQFAIELYSENLAQLPQNQSDSPSATPDAT